MTSNPNDRPDEPPELRSTGAHRLLFMPGAPTGTSARQAASRLRASTPDLDLSVADPRPRSGKEHPDELPDEAPHPMMRRTFCFVDLSGFTSFTREHGPHAAVELIQEFRTVTRNYAARRGVRIAKWLGDGAMLVAVDAGAAVALGTHLAAHFADHPVAIRVGIATGDAIMFDGDDYIGEPVNLAAKLCAAAEPREILADVDPEDIPPWVTTDAEVEVDIRSMGRIGGIRRLHAELRSG